MKIVIDAMGGDFAPLEILKGTAEASKITDATLILVGNSEIISDVAQKNNIDLSGIEIVHAENQILMTDPPLSVRSKKDTSLRKGFEMLANKEADAFVSAGSTGAVQTGATLFVRRIEGVEKAGIATVLPFKNPTLLLDCGANTSFTPSVLNSYAVMGSFYMENVCNVKNPRVGLLNIGVEEGKGTAEHREAYELLKNNPSLHFVGNIEPPAAVLGGCDVLVTDGFTGNILLKTVEGLGKYILTSVKEALTSDFKSKMGALLCKNNIQELKKQFDSSEYGGALLLGIKAPILKAHGSADAKTIKNAILFVKKYSETNVVSKIQEELKREKEEREQQQKEQKEEP